MNTYYLRALTRAELVTIGVDLGLLIDDEEGTRAASPEIVWDEIGTIYRPTDELDEAGNPIMAPVNDYWHANLYMPHDLTAWAQAKAEEYAGTERGERVLAAIERQTEYFPLNPEGQPRSPASPVRVLWT